MLYRYSNKDSERNKLLIRMWELNNLLAQGEELSPEDRQFWNEHLSLIQTYYSDANVYWNLLKPLT